MEESALPIPSVIPQTEQESRDNEQQHEVAEEDEYVLLDLEEVFHGAGLPSNCPYTLTGLDTMNPILILGDGGLKLIGEYEETIGTCLVFTEHEESILGVQVRPQEDVNSSELNDQNKVTGKKINSLCKLERKLKFRIMDSKDEAGTR